MSLLSNCIEALNEAGFPDPSGQITGIGLDIVILEIESFIEEKINEAVSAIQNPPQG